MLLSPPRDGSPYNVISGNLAEWQGKITFSEARFQKIEDGYTIFCYATAATHLEKFGDKNWKFEPCLITFTIHSKEWQRNTKVNGEWKKEPTQPQVVEVFLCQLFDSDPALYQAPDKAFAGFFKFDSYSSDLLLTGKDQDGKPVEESLLNWVKSQTYSLIETPVNLIQSMPEAKKRAFGGGAATQTMASQLTDKFDFLCKMLAPYVNQEKKPDSFLGLAIVLKDIKLKDPDVIEEVLFLINAFLRN